VNHQDHEILELIAQGESLKLEFKSDRNGIPDRELIAAVVALANTEGGALLLGVEDDGTITGIDKHGGIRREEAMELCRLGKDQAYRLLKKLVNSDQIQFQGKGKGGKYVRRL
jgi:ATP-dependent DNA helicase RecG